MAKHTTVSMMFLLTLCFASPAEATLIRTVFAFNAGGDVDVSGLNTQTVVAVADNNGNTIQFDVNIMVSNANGPGAVYDTSFGTGGGLSLTAGQGLQANDEIQFDLVSITNFNGDLDGNGRRITLEGDSTFRFIGTISANGSGSRGTVITPSFVVGSSDWEDANGPGADFFGHLPGTTNYVRDKASAFNVSAGFDLQDTNAANGGSSTVPITSFSHLTVTTGANPYRLNNLVVEVRANPEPSSMLLGLVAMISLPFAYSRKRFCSWVAGRGFVAC